MKKKELARVKTKGPAKVKKKELARVRKTRAKLQRQLSEQRTSDSRKKLLTTT